MTATGELGALVQRVRRAAEALAELASAATAVGPELVDAIRATRDEVERRLSSDELAVALAGEPAARRSLLNAVAGARAFEPSARTAPADAVITLRAARSFDYTARLRDGTVVEFGVRMPDREESFARARERARQEHRAAEATVRELEARVEEAEEELADKTLQLPSPPPPPRPSLARRVWLWIARVALALVGRRPAVQPRVLPPGPANDAAVALAALEQSLAEARARVEQLAARIASVRSERPKYDQERAEAFVQEVRDLTDGAARGGQVVSLSVACPTTHLPADVVLVDAGDRETEATGVVYVAFGNGAPRPESLAWLGEAVRPAKVQVVRKLGELAGALDRIRSERPVVAAARAAAAVRRCIARVSEEGARAEAVCQKRIAALESQRIPDPADFRARALLRVARAIDDGARDVEKAAMDRWRASIAQTKQDWRLGVETCADRKEMEAFVGTINRTAPARLQALVDDVGHHAVLELQRSSETMQIWLLEEIHARYNLARRIEEGDEPAAVIGEAIDLAPLARAPLQSALDKFETRRVGLGLGGVAAGAVLGTLIVPGVGTAIGAFVGVFAGFFKGLDSLKQECVARLDACLDDVERSVAAQIEGRHASFADALRSSLDEALDQAMQRLEASIGRLMDLERRVLESERKKREDLARLRAGLDDDAARVARAR